MYECALQAGQRCGREIWGRIHEKLLKKEVKKVLQKNSKKFVILEKFLRSSQIFFIKYFLENEMTLVE